MTISDHRLPRTVVPRHYDLTIEPDLDGATFGGRVSITVDITEATDEVVLNAIELDITRATAHPPAGDELTATVSLDEDRERAQLDLPDALPAGPAELHLEFTGTLNDQLHGFYRSTFTDADGTEQTIATTQFEATDARRAFPCFDEPDLKASFGITLVVDDDLLAVSNAREIERVPTEDGRVTVTFADTMVMSTYLVAFIVGPLEVTPPVTANGVDLRIVHPPGQRRLTAFALEVGGFALDFFADWYGIEYPGDKLDLVAVPDFAFGAMENLGCVTFREVLLLVDPDQATQPELQNVVDVIAHELAHMWFGDLVTMRWWNGIWLNEAFATFMEMLATDAFRPAWKRWVSFGTARSAALDIDALHTTRPVEFEVVSPADAEGMFDVLTYEKGAATVRMLEQYLGAEPFQAGIRRYLDDHQYANTETTDLWDALEAESGQPTRRIMDSWIFQGGYPLLSARLDGDDVVVSQERFTYRDGAEPAEWVVPVVAEWQIDGARRAERLLLDGPTTTLQPGGAVDWLNLNSGGSGFYRVAYDPSLRDHLATHAQAALTPVERYQFLDDLWAAVVSGRAAAGDGLDLVRRWHDETDLSVWERMIGVLGTINRLIDDDARSSLQQHVRDLLGPALDRVGREPADDDGDRVRQLRGALFATLGSLGADPAVRAEAAVLHERHQSDRGAADPALVAAAVAVLADVGGTGAYETFRSRYEGADEPQERLRYLYALADFEDPELFATTLEMIEGDQVRSQNAPYLIRRALSQRVRGIDAWHWLTEHWDMAEDRYPSNSIARMLEGIRALDRAEYAEAVTSFLDDHEVPQGAKTVAQHRERLAVNVALREREADALTRRLAAG